MQKMEKSSTFLATFFGAASNHRYRHCAEVAEADDFLVKPLRSILPAQHFALRAVAEALMAAAKKKIKNTFKL